MSIVVAGKWIQKQEEDILLVKFILVIADPLKPILFLKEEVLMWTAVAGESTPKQGGGFTLIRCGRTYVDQKKLISFLKDEVSMWIEDAGA